MNPRFTKLFVLGASLLTSGAVSAAPFIGQFTAHDDMHAGALWANDRPNNNNQRGAGAEHQKIIRVGENILVVATGSYTDVVPMIPGAGMSSAEAGILPPRDASGPGQFGAQAQGTRIQGLCTSYKIDATLGLVKTNMSYFTNNNSPDWQNAHKMSGVAIDGGKAALVTFGHDPNGNRTRIYARVLGPNCEILSPQQQQFASNNDDYGGNQLAGLVQDTAEGARACGTFIGNGNGEDDGHAFCITAKKTGTGASTYSVTPDWEINTEANEERTRAEVALTGIPNRMLACWAAGNNQPPDRGLRCGLINTAAGVNENDRLVWRQYVIQRDGNLMYSTPSLAPITDAAGNPTDKFILNYVQVDVSNRQGRAKGSTEIQTVPVRITDQGLEPLDAPQKGLFGLSDGAHPGMTHGVYGVDKRPVAFLWSGNITDGGTAALKIVGMTPEGRLEPIRALNWASMVSGGYTSLWYGHNPNTPQGRTYPVSSLTIDNPGWGVATGYQPEVKQFLVAANVHHIDRGGACPYPTSDANGSNNGTCGGKNALSISLIPVAAEAKVEPTEPTGPSDPTPVDPTDPAGEEPDYPEIGGGCSSSTPGGFGTLAFLGLGALLIRRRRRA